MSQRDRALGAFWGLALGDALGMPTQALPRRTVQALFGALDGFRDAPVENEISAGMAAGCTTDDTDQAVIVATTLLAGNGHVDLRDLADRLLAWQLRMQAAGSTDLLGPSTLRALSAVSDGAPIGTTGRWGDTDGAAMRVTPLGIATRVDDLDAFCAAVADLNRLTHDTTVANAGACAVAAVVSAGVDGASWQQARPIGEEAARRGATFGFYVPGADVGRRIGWGLDLCAGLDDEDLLDRLDGLVGTGVATQEAVPAAFAIAAHCPGDAFRAGTLAARLGGDSDTIAAMAGAMIGACTGLSTMPADAVAHVRAVNDLQLEPLVDGLLRLRGPGLS